MICENCHGRGIIRKAVYPFFEWEHGSEEPARRPAYPYRTLICRDCMGSGIVHCCDGLIEQPEEDCKNANDL